MVHDLICFILRGMRNVNHLEVLLLPQNDLQKYQQRMKELQTHSEQQSKVLKVKTEEVYTL